MTHVPPAENIVLASVRHATKRSGSVAMAALLAVVLVFVPSSAMAAVPSVEATIEVGADTQPTGIAISPDGRRAYVTNYRDRSVSVIDLDTLQLVTTIEDVGTNPTSIAISPNGDFAYVTNFDDAGPSDSVRRINIDLDTLEPELGVDILPPDTLPAFAGPVNVVFSPQGDRAYVTNRGLSGTPNEPRVSIIDTDSDTVIGSIPVGRDANYMVLSDDGRTLYVSHPPGQVTRLSGLRDSNDPNLPNDIPTVTKDFIGEVSRARGVALTGSGASTRLWVTRNTSLAIYNVSDPDAISGGSPVTTLSDFTQPEGLALNGPQATASLLYVANSDGTSGTNLRIIEVDSPHTVSSNVTVGTGPFAVAVAPDGLRAAVTNRAHTTNNSVSIIGPYQARTLTFGVTSYAVAYGANQTVAATPSAGAGTGTVSYSAGASNACTVNSSTGVVTMTAGTGTCSISASITRGGTTAATAFAGAQTTTPVTITPSVAPLGITAASLTVASGGTVTPNFSITSGVLVSPDAISGMTYTFQGTGSTTYSASTTPPTAIGTYSITPSVATFSTGNAANYNITYTAGTLVIQAQSSGSSGSGGSSSGATTPAPVVGPAPSQVPRRPSLLPVAPNTAPVAQPVARPGLGFDPNAPVRGSVGGTPTNVTNAPAGSAGVAVTAGAFQFGLSLRGPSDDAVATDTPSRSPELQIARGQSAAVSGGGSYPGSFVQLWLPGNGTDARELARIPVNSDGTFVSDLTFGAGPLEMPVPIGRQVLQVVGYDERGNQTVIDMTINIGQGVPAPEPNRQVGALPALLAGQSLATSGGIPEPVVVRAIPDARSASIEGDGWAMSVNVDRAEAVAENGDGDVLLRLEQSSSGTAGGSGFLPGTLATVWLFSDPTLMATVTVDDAGAFSADFLVDRRLILPGEHTLQVQGVGADGFIKAVNLGVVVEEPVQLTSDSASGLLYWIVGLVLVAILVGVLFMVAIKRRRRVA